MSARQVLLEAHTRALATRLRRRAWSGLFDGHADAPGMVYMQRCSIDDQSTATRLIFTRDSGHHTSGWMRNPEYERCWHLSVSASPRILVPGMAQQIGELDAPTTRLWLKAFFGDDARLTWLESAKSSFGKARGVQHWRLFADDEWKPLMPRGEVYSSQFTELGWRSASQVLEEDGVSIFSTVDPS